MADFVTYENTVPNYTGGQDLMLEIFSRDGSVGIRLVEGDDRRVKIEIEEARRVIAALNEAIDNLKAKA